MQESDGRYRSMRTPRGAPGVPARAAAGGAAAALCLLAVLGAAGCVSTAPPPRSAPVGFVESEAEAGARLYRIGDYTLAARRFRAAADEAERCDEPLMESELRTGECTAWLRGGELDAFRHCTARLEALHRDLGLSEPGVNTLLALGAIARGEPLPPFRLPAAVRPLLMTTASGGK